MDASESQGVRGKWSADDAGGAYSKLRFRSGRAAARDPALVAAILRDFGVRGRVLDVPCGSGRLQPALARSAAGVVGMDASASMLVAARSAGAKALVCADAERMPFADRAFDVVVCCRLLHHFHEQAELERAVGELVRVSSRLVIASFWDSASLPRLRVKLCLKRSEGPRGRTTRSRALIAQSFAAAGARALEFRGVLRFVSQQTFVVAERE
jgi:ubiquinone/menaquinone biosynthesis C-methylase UbiE